MGELKAFYFRFSSRDTALDKLGFDRCWQSAISWGCKEEDIYCRKLIACKRNEGISSFVWRDDELSCLHWLKKNDDKSF